MWGAICDTTDWVKTADLGPRSQEIRSDDVHVKIQDEASEDCTTGEDDKLFPKHQIP